MAKRKPTREKPAKPSLLDIARELPKKRPGNKLIFIDKVSPECRAELLELRAAYQSGQLEPHIDGRYLFTHVFDVKYPGTCSDCTFRRWLATRDNSNGQS